MRPLSLSIEGLRSFRKEVEIDFGDRNQIAVVGDTGAGKSSILEAMTYALYGKTTFGGHNQDLMNDASEKMRVVFRFGVSAEEWDVARTLRRDGQGQAKPSGARLRRLGKDGEPLEMVDQVKQINERVERLIGLDRDAFLRTVVLPQGRFARLLVEDRPMDRSRILRQLWPTEDLEAVGALASQALEDVGKTRAQLEQEATAHTEDPEAHLKRLIETAATARRKADAANALEEKASQALQSLKTAAEAGRLASQEGARLERGLSLIDEAEAQVAPVAEVLKEVDQADTELKRKQAGLRDELDRIPAEDGPDLQEVETALARLDDFGDRAAEAVKQAEEMRDKAARAESRRGDAGRARDAVATATEEEGLHAKARPPLAEAAEAAEVRCAEARLDHQKCEGLRRRAAEAEAEVAKLKDGRAGLDRQVGKAAEEARKAKAAAGEAEAELAGARRANSAAAAAQGLDPGDDCPVCLRVLPEGWSRPEDAGQTEAETAVRATREAAQETDRRHAGARAEMRSVEKQLREANADGKQASEECRTALTALGAKFGDAPAEVSAGAGGAPPLPSLDALLAPLEAERRKASDALAGHDDKHKTLEAERARLSENAATMEAEARSAGQLAEAARQSAADSLARLDRNVNETPAPYRPLVDLPSDPAQLDQIDLSAASGPRADAQERKRVLKRREKRRQELNGGLEETGNRRDALAQRRVAEVERPLAAAVEPLDRHRVAVLQAVRALDLGDVLDADLPGAPSPNDPAANQAWMRRLRDVTRAVVQVAGTRAREAAAAEQDARTALDDLGRELAARRVAEAPSLDAEATPAGMPVAEPPSSPEDVRSAAVAAHRDADHEARTTAGRRDGFAAIKDDVLALRALLDEAGRLERALSDLDKALKPGAFPKWLTLRRSRSLLVHASRVLGEISGGKYAFADPENDDAQWSVLDNHSGQPRSPASLSGGEQFIASLALALGMVEMMARSGGRLESLFLDEGFGALDRRNLDAAVEALGAVAARGRMVAVISHLRAVAEQIDHVLAVERTDSGSRAKWLSRAERLRLSASDAGAEVSAAYGGLVE